MAASGTTSFRTDEQVEAAISGLIAASEPARSRSEVIRQAILDAAKLAQREALRREAEALMADPEQVAETMRVHAEMDAIRAW